MFLFGVINASPDSVNIDSIVEGPDEALTRARALLRQGADALDLGGQGSTPASVIAQATEEWQRLESIVAALAALDVPLSIDTWRPEVAHRALSLGATMLNAADGMQSEDMWAVASDHQVDIVIPFLSGPHPHALKIITSDPIESMIQFFDARLRVARRFGLERRCFLDPGTGFAPHDRTPEQHFRYQKYVYGHLDALRRFDRPLYIALPWRDTPRERELLEMVLRARPELGRAHYPATVRAAELALDTGP
ncbi:MAG: dihydropteroate synthase [Actinomycetota bacterium]